MVNRVSVWRHVLEDLNRDLLTAYKEDTLGEFLNPFIQERTDLSCTLNGEVTGFMIIFHYRGTTCFLDMHHLHVGDFSDGVFSQIPIGMGVKILVAVQAEFDRTVEIDRGD